MKKKTISDEQKRLHRRRRHRLELARSNGTSITLKFTGAAVVPKWSCTHLDMQRSSVEIPPIATVSFVFFLST